MTTKERIIDESLTLFSQKGFNGVSVKEIADAVGIKDSSLYKHFSSKKEIYDTIIEGMTARICQMSKELKMPEVIDDEAADILGRISVGELVAITQKAFIFYCTDSYASRFRRMLQREQNTDNNESDLYKKLFMVDSISYQKQIFASLIKKGYMRQINPEIVAMNFYAPVFLLINKYDGCEDKQQEALDIIEEHVREFTRIYIINNKDTK